MLKTDTNTDMESLLVNFFYSSQFYFHNAMTFLAQNFYYMVKIKIEISSLPFD